MSKTLAIVLAVTLTATAAFAQTRARRSRPKVPARATVDATLMQQEQSMHASIANKDWTTFRRLVASDAWNIDDDGPMSIADFLKATQDPKFNLSYQYKTSDMKVVNASPTTKIVTYKLEQQGSLMGRPFPPTVYASTVWVRRGGTWQAVLHQESTPAPKK